MEILLWIYVFKVLIYTTRRLCNKWILYMKCGIVPISAEEPWLPKLMIQWHRPIISRAAKYVFDRVYRPPRCWEGWICSTLCFMIPEVVGGKCRDTLPMLLWWRQSGTRGHGRAVLRHTPHVVVMTMFGCLVGEARSVVQPTLSLSGSYVVRSVKLPSTSILAEEG